MLFLIFLLFFLICGGLAALTILNFTTQVHLTVMSWQSPDLPIGFWMILAFALGAILFYLFSIASARSDRREMKWLQERVTALEREKEATSATNGPASVTAPVSMASNVSAPNSNATRPTGPLMPMPGTVSSPQQSQRGDSPPQNFR